MFKILRRVSGSLFPRPDRPWGDDATSHAPTIGRKRRRSTVEQESGRSASSTAKRTKNDVPVKPDTECDSASGGESPRGDAVPPVEVKDVKEVTKGVKEVELEDKDKPEDVASIQPEDLPLPDSPSESPVPASESPESEPAKSDVVEETEDLEHADDVSEDSAASTAPEDDAEEGAETGPVTKNVDEITPVPDVIVAIESCLEAKA